MEQLNCQSCVRYDVSGNNIIKPLIKRGSKVLLLAAEPVQEDLRYKTAFTCPTSMIIKKLLYKISIDLGLPDNMFSYAYTVKCVDDKNKFDAHTISCCNAQLMNTIETVKPEYIIAFGIEAVKALGINATKLANIRGTFVDFPKNSNIKVMPTFGYRVIKSVSGKLPVLEQDLLKVCSQVVASKDNDVGVKYRYDRDSVNICNVLNEVIDYIDTKHKETGKKVLISLDTETHLKLAYRHDSKIIAISMCWDPEWGGYAYPFKHKDNPFTEEELNEISRLTRQIITDDRVSLTLANGKFDYGFLSKENLGNIRPDWDVLIGEHCLDEDKTGEYSLKVLTTDYFPSIGKYADELHDEDVRIDKKVAAMLSEKITNTKIGFGYNVFSKLRNLDSKKIVEELDYIKLNATLNKSQKTSLQALRDLFSADTIEIDDESNIVRALYKDGKIAISMPKATLGTVIMLIAEVAYGVDTDRGTNLILGKYGEELSNTLTIIEDECQKSFEMYDIDILLKYAAIDAYTTMLITKKQVERFNIDTQKIDNIFKKEKTPIPIPPLFNVMFKHAMPLSRSISVIEYGGVPLDIQKINNIIPELEKKERELTKGIISNLGYVINIKSTPQLADLIYNQLNLPVESTTTSGSPSVDEATLNKLADKYNVQVLKDIVTLRKIRKVKDTYLKSWLNLSRFDGKLHASFNIIGTATGRLSCSEPNLQNVPAYLAGINMKSIFIPENDDYVIIDCDIANAEMRVLCAYSRDPDLINAFNNNIDLHTLTASKLTEGMMTYEEIAKNKEDKTHFAYAIRQVAKKINFGVIYGISKYGIARDQRKELVVLLEHKHAEKGLTNEQIEELYCNTGMEVYLRSSISKGADKVIPPREELIKLGFEESIVNLAQELIDSFYVSYPQVGNYVKYTQNFLSKYFVALTYTGRRRRFDLSRYSKEALAKAKRQSINSRIQGTSSDIVMTNLVGINNMLEYTKLGKILLTVHDSICFQFRKDKLHLAKPMLDAILVQWTAKRYPWLPVKWKYDAAYGPNYGDCHGELPISDKSFIELCKEDNIEMSEKMFENIMNM